MINLDLYNFAEIARQIRRSRVYVQFLLTGERKNEKALAEIAKVIKVDAKDLKKEIKRRRKQLLFDASTNCRGAEGQRSRGELRNKPINHLTN